MNRDKVVVGMSGGVDSSVTALLLIEKGYEVIGVTLKTSTPIDEGKKTEIDEASEYANSLGIKHIILDVRDEFKRVVEDYFIKEYTLGNTPSPCIVCDENIKIEKLFQVADELGAEFVATGHYCKVDKINPFNKPLLRVSFDKKKDQSYMLYRVKSQYLDRLLFPLATYKKSEVREIAKKYGLEVWKKKDSQGICFAPDGYIPYLKEKLGDNIKKGDIVDVEGRVIGTHSGYQLYTIGQRKGMGIKTQKRYFVLDIIPEKNILIAGDFSHLMRDKITIDNFSTNLDPSLILGIKILGKPRFSSGGSYGVLSYENDRFLFTYDDNNPQNARGQHIVFYLDDLVIGGGVISHSL